MADTGLEDRILAALHRKPLDIPFVAITGGKGGVGKSTISVNIVTALVGMGYKVSLMDADVDAPDDHIMLGIAPEKPLDVLVNAPVIDAEKCTRCRRCTDACRRNALFEPGDGVPILIGDCNGCEACILACPEDAMGKDGRRAGIILNFSDLPGPREKITVMSKAFDAEIFCELPMDDLLLRSHVEGVPAVTISSSVGIVLFRRARLWREPSF